MQAGVSDLLSFGVCFFSFNICVSCCVYFTLNVAVFLHENVEPLCFFINNVHVRRFGFGNAHLQACVNGRVVRAFNAKKGLRNRKKN
jgi:hypothetical protein